MPCIKVWTVAGTQTQMFSLSLIILQKKSIQEKDAIWVIQDYLILGQFIILRLCTIFLPNILSLKKLNENNIHIFNCSFDNKSKINKEIISPSILTRKMIYSLPKIDCLDLTHFDNMYRDT